MEERLWLHTMLQCHLSMIQRNMGQLKSAMVTEENVNDLSK